MEDTIGDRGLRLDVRYVRSKEERRGEERRGEREREREKHKHRHLLFVCNAGAVGAAADAAPMLRPALVQRLLNRNRAIDYHGPTLYTIYALRAPCKEPFSIVLMIKGALQGALVA